MRLYRNALFESVEKILISVILGLFDPSGSDLTETYDGEGAAEDGGPDEDGPARGWLFRALGRDANDELLVLAMREAPEPFLRRCLSLLLRRNRVASDIVWVWK